MDSKLREAEDTEVLSNVMSEERQGSSLTGCAASVLRDSPNGTAAYRWVISPCRGLGVA